MAYVSQITPLPIQQWSPPPEKKRSAEGQGSASA